MCRLEAGASTSPLPRTRRSPSPKKGRDAEVTDVQNDARVEESRAHGRYYAEEYVRLTSKEPRGVQGLLDEKDGREWHLVGVASGLPENGAILFWDTRRPSFGRRTG